MWRYFKIGKESTFGTAASTLVALDPKSESLKVSNELLTVESFIHRERLAAYPGPLKIDGDVDFFMQPFATARALAAVLGNPTITASPSSDAYSWEFTPQDTVPSWTIEIGYEVSGYAKQYVGLIGTKAQIEAPARELGTVTLSFVGKSISLVSPNAPALSDVKTGTPFSFVNGTVKADGSVVSTVEAISLTVNNGINTDAIPFGGRELGGIYVKGLDVEGTMDLAFTSWEWFQRLLGSTTATSPQTTLNPVSLELTFVGDSTGSSDSGYENYKLTIELPKVYINTSDLNAKQRDRILQRVEFQAVVDSSLGYSMKATLITTEGSL